MGLWYPKWYPKNSGCLGETHRFSRPNGGVPLSTSKAVYGLFTTIFSHCLSGEVPLRPCKAFYPGNESGNASTSTRAPTPEADPPGWHAWQASSKPPSRRRPSRQEPPSAIQGSRASIP